eukprot:11194421-Lingulodinium_polyedra.AAC.1
MTITIVGVQTPPHCGLRLVVGVPGDGWASTTSALWPQAGAVWVESGVAQPHQHGDHRGADGVPVEVRQG